MRLAVLREPFDSDDWLFELKYDGFRASADVHNASWRLFSRNKNVYNRFPVLCRDIAGTIKVEVVLDGEIMCLDADGHPQFCDLLRRGSGNSFSSNGISESIPTDVSRSGWAKCLFTACSRFPAHRGTRSIARPWNA